MTHKVGHNDGSEDWDWDIQQAEPLLLWDIMKSIEHQFDKGRDVEWIEKTIEGGVEYNSIGKYI